MVAGNDIRVDIEALAGSAAHVAGQGEELATAHVTSDDLMATAQSGWVGSSAAALRARTAVWLETSRRLVASVGDHALTLHNDGINYTAFQREHIDRLRALHDGRGEPA